MVSNSTPSPRLTRRQCVALAAVGAAGALLAACSNASTTSTATASVQSSTSAPFQASKVAWKGTMKVYLGGLQPSVPRNNGLQPLTAGTKLADQWQSRHPGVTIDFIQIPSTQGVQELAAWIKSNQAAKTMPEICWVQDNELSQDIGRTNFWVPLTKIVDTPNTYEQAGEPGAKHWRDAFVTGFTPREQMLDGNYYYVPSGLTSVQFVTNQDLLAKAGLQESTLNRAPFGWSWQEMLADAQKLKANGAIPWAVGWQKSAVPQWITTTMLTAMLKATGLFAKMDLNHDGFIDATERWEAYKNGTFKETGIERQTIWKMTKDWSQYWPQGALGLVDLDEQALWFQGKAVFYWTTAGIVPQIVKDTQRTFKWGVTRFADISQEAAKIGKVAVGRTTFPGGAGGSGWAITSTATDKGNVNLAVDFLKFLTTKQATTLLDTEEGGTVPAVKGATGNPALNDFQPPDGETFLLTPHEVSLNLNFGTIYGNLFAEYLGGQLPLMQALRQVEDAALKAADAALKKINAQK